MFIVWVYDSENSSKFRKVLKKFLFWRQNSVFDWELTQWDLEKLKNDISKLIDTDSNDYVIIYIFKKIWSKALIPEIIEYWKKRSSEEFVL